MRAVRSAGVRAPRGGREISAVCGAALLPLTPSTDYSAVGDLRRKSLTALQSGREGRIGMTDISRSGQLSRPAVPLSVKPQQLNR